MSETTISNRHLSFSISMRDNDLERVCLLWHLFDSNFEHAPLTSGSDWSIGRDICCIIHTLVHTLISLIFFFQGNCLDDLCRTLQRKVAEHLPPQNFRDAVSVQIYFKENLHTCSNTEQPTVK